MKLTEHFHLEEFIFSNYAQRHHINNEASPEIAHHLLILAKGLEQVRTLLGDKPMSISSGYRSPELNTKINGAISSHHRLGYAADFSCWSFGKSYDIVKAIVNSDIEYDQVIDEGRWVHISFKPSYRKQALAAKFNSNRRASYSAFV
jgi:hypothetical protein